jgi:hypothetical protein
VVERRQIANTSKSVGFAESTGDLKGKLAMVQPIPGEEVPQSLDGDFSQWTSVVEEEDDDVLA